MKTFKKTYLLFLFSLSLFLSSCSKDEIEGFEPDPEPYVVINPIVVSIPPLLKPSDIIGVKWRQNADEEFLQNTINWWLNKPPQTTKLQVLQGIEQQANSVIIRIFATML